MSQASLLKTCKYIFVRECLLVSRNLSEVFNPIFFYLLIVMLFPLGISPAKDQLAPIAAGLLWVPALLATLLVLEQMFRYDFESGVLEQWSLSQWPLSVLVLVKVLAQWLLMCAPLVILSPILGVMLHIPTHALLTVLSSLLLGTPTLSLMGAIGAALVVGLRRGGVVLSLIVLPLYIPVLIFGTAMIQAAIQGLPVVGFAAILGAMLLLSLVLAPFAIAGAVRMSVS